MRVYPHAADSKNDDMETELSPQVVLSPPRKKQPASPGKRRAGIETAEGDDVETELSPQVTLSPPRMKQPASVHP